MKTPTKPTFAVCTSANFYRQAVEVEEQLTALGFAVVLPYTAYRMKESGDYDASHYRTWQADANDYPKKAKLMRLHFDEITKGDVVLVLNYEKHGKQNYIGGNVLMEMSLAFFQQKPIFILNEAPEDSTFLEEILGMMPVFLHGKLENLPKELAKLQV
ncbi:MAG TPA: hypothetical protein VJR27_04710 [Candidatus Saccharimonadales bacterium]|nr:hypothetical protein [Candidatus Saccharimonadales bacterium]